jgi:excisionase family DNA binding protein
MPERLLTKESAREVLRVSRPTLNRLIERGELPVIRVAGRTIRIAERDLVLFIEQRTERRRQN